MINKTDIEHLLKEHWTRFWGKDYKVTPAFVEKVLGDGNQLLGIEPMDTRPDYYLIRVDSSWNQENWSDAPEKVCDHINEILDAIEEEYGRGYLEADDENPEEYLEFPALSCDSGVSWFDMTPERKRYANG